MTPFNIADGPYRRDPALVASFSNAGDLICWLAKQHGITVHAVAAGGGHLSVSFPLVGEVPSNAVATERLVPRRVSPLEDDGTEEWTKWDGHMPPGFIKGEKCVAKLRNDTRIFTSTGENDGCDWWWKSSPTTSTVRQHAYDVVAYRPV